MSRLQWSSHLSPWSVKTKEAVMLPSKQTGNLEFRSAGYSQAVQGGGGRDQYIYFFLLFHKCLAKYLAY